MGTAIPSYTAERTEERTFEVSDTVNGSGDASAYAIAALHESHLNYCRNDHPFDDCPALAAWDKRRKEEDA